MSHHRRADGDPPDDVSYEDFDDDSVWHDPDDDLDVIDLDALDDPVTGPADAEPGDKTEPETGAGDTQDDIAEATARMMQTLIARDQGARDQGARDQGARETPPALEAESGDDTPDSDAEDEPEPETGDTVPDEGDPGGKDEPEQKTPTPTETQTETVAAATAAESEAETGPPPDWVYHVLIALPQELTARVLELRAAGEIEDMPPPGIALAGSFRAADIAAVEEQLARWARNQLPLQVEITAIVAEVNGMQDYLAAWSLRPEEELVEAQHNLRRAVAMLVEPLPGTRAPLTVHLVIGDHVPAARYPHLIGRMQREFEPYVWHATDLLLVRKDAEADDGAWGITQQYD